MAALERELKERSDDGAGLVELLDHLETSNRRFGRRERLSRQELDDLSLYCWTLKRDDSGQLRGRARELWGSKVKTSRARSLAVRGPRSPT